MATAYNPSIVTSGLVLCLDAGNRKSYPGTGTQFLDISGRNGNGTLVNNPTYSSSNEGSLVFNGSNTYVQISLTSSITTTAATFIAWLYRNGNQNSYAGIIFSRGNGGSNTGMDYYSTTNNIGYHWNDIQFTWNSNLTVPDLSWSMLALSVSSSSATAYLCQASGISSAVNNVSHGSTTLANISLGRDSQGAVPPRNINGNGSIFMVYNRALSRIEIEQNFNVARARYGI